jgi:hypothetical protein
MKATLCNSILFLFLLPISLFAGGETGKFEKEKKINKSFTVSAHAITDIDNKYGDIDIRTWNEDRVAIDVVIRVSGNNESDVVKRLNTINVEFNAAQSKVSAKTVFGRFSGKTSKMQVNYVVYIPQMGGLNIDNQYGNITMGKINGPAEIDLDYGNLHIDELNHITNEVELSYSKASKIGYIKSGELSPQYSTVTIGKAGILKIESQYSTLNIDDIEQAGFDIDYGKFNVKNADKLSGTADYVQTSIGTIHNILNITANYGNIRIGDFGKTAKNVAINSNYTSITIPGGSGVDYDFEYQLEYSKLNGGNGYHFTQKEIKGNTGSFKGYNNKPGGTRLYIDTEYGNIHVGGFDSPSAPKAPQAPQPPTPPKTSTSQKRN